MKKKIVLTGGVASGKTYVSMILERLNAFVIDTDIITRELLSNDNDKYSLVAIEGIKERLGRHVVVDGAVDRRILRDIVFNDSQQRKALESIMHPLIHKVVLEYLSIESDKEYFLIVVPLLSQDSSYIEFADEILSIEVDPAVQLERLIERDQLSSNLAEKIIKSQVSNNERRKLANTIIINTNKLFTQKILNDLDKRYSLPV